MSNFEQRVASQVDREMHTQPLTWWWLSFADPDRPEGEQFLGACVVQAYGVVSAAMEAHTWQCNPGGQVQAVPLPEHVDASPWGNFLLSRQECHQFDRWMAETYP